MATTIYGSHRAICTVTIANGAAITSTGGLKESEEAATNGIIATHKWAWGSIQIPAAWTAADITFKVCDTSGGTYLLAYDKDAGLLRSKVGSNTSISIAMPGEVFQHGVYMKLNSTNTGSAADVNQGGARILTVILGA